MPAPEGADTLALYDLLEVQRGLVRQVGTGLEGDLPLEGITSSL